MTLQQIPINLNRKKPYIRSFITWGEDTYIFTFQWSFYCKSASLSIADYDNNPIITGRALTNGLIIRNHNLPNTLYFAHKNNKTFEPTLNTISSEFILYFDDEEVV